MFLILALFDRKHFEQNHFQLSWADIWVAELMARLSELDASIIEPYANVKKHVAMVQALPAIKTWVEKRPKTSF